MVSSSIHFEILYGQRMFSIAVFEWSPTCKDVKSAAGRVQFPFQNHLTNEVIENHNVVLEGIRQME